jgi:hypothetical protein
MELSRAAVKHHAAEVVRTSATVLRRLLPVALIDAWHEAFQPLLAETVERNGPTGNRGPCRYYITLPFTAPWADPRVVDNDAIMGVVSTLVGPDGAMSQLGSDTPLRGSEDQSLHRDAPIRLPGRPVRVKPSLLAVNIPLVDVTEANGPMEYAPGSQHRTDAEALRRIAAGEMPIERVLMERGDVLIRDVRHLHRGTANPGAPRPVVVIGYQRPFGFRADVGIRVPRATFEALPERTRRWLRFSPVVESAESLEEERSILPPPARAD